MIRFDENSSLSDTELLALGLAHKDNEPLNQLYIRYIPLVYGVCLKYLRQSDLATDAVSAIYEEVIHKLRRYEIREFRTWLYSVAKNYCLAQLNRKWRINVEISDNFMEFDILDTLSDSEDRERQISDLQDCLKKMPEKQRQCIKEFYFENKSYADIVIEQRMALKSVKSSIQNGRRNLKICMDKKD